ncbi:hypothetical protein D3C87_1730020 [compost metagenome]
MMGVLHLRRVVGFWQHHGSDAGVTAGCQILLMPQRVGGIDAHRHALIGMLIQPGQQGQARRRFVDRCHRVFKIDHNDVGAAGQRFTNAFRAVRRHE